MRDENVGSSPIENMMNRASIRRFEARDIPGAVIEKVVRAGQQAPFTGQMYSVVVTSEPEIREQLGELFGHLPRAAPVFALLCIDFRKLEKFIEARGRENHTDDLSMLFLGIQDVAYMGQNMVLAAEAYGLGSCFLGAAPFLARELGEIFSLPKRVYPLVGMVMGYPAENPRPRPRIPLEYVLHWDRYRDLEEADVDVALDVMDAGLIREGYYRRLNAKIALEKEEEDPTDYDRYGWGEHVSRKYSRGRRVFGYLLELLREQGIDVSD